MFVEYFIATESRRKVLVFLGIYCCWEKLIVAIKMGLIVAVLTTASHTIRGLGFIQSEDTINKIKFHLDK